MADHAIKGVLPRGAIEDVWSRTLAQVPSLFGRLVYLAHLRDQNSGTYEHHGLALIFGEQEADRALRESHAKAFAEWLCFSLEEQREDLNLYLTDLQVDRKTTVETWLRLAPYRGLIPAAARQVERELYISDIEVLLGVLKNELGAAVPDPDA